MNAIRGAAVRLLCVASIAASTGCVTPWTTRLPVLAARSPELERRDAQIQDPFPDSKWGPDTQFRPLGYQRQRSEPHRAKDRFYTSLLRIQHAVPTGPAPPVAPGAYSTYPGTVQ